VSDAGPSERKTWDAGAYDASHAYVFTLAADLLEMLNPAPGERILDVGCGTGHLTAKIANSGATVVGIDSSPEMVGRARATYPHLDVRVGDVTALELDGPPFDAVFSNAVLHWVPRADEAAACMYRALRPGGRFVAEFGGAGNVRRVSAAIDAGLAAVGAPPLGSLSTWYFPTIREYAAVLERAGFEVTFARLFDRPTPVEGGLRSWVEMFGSAMLRVVGEGRREAFFAAVEGAAPPELFRDGTCYVDYRRLRVNARRPD
jgi:trans-aconitate methyltransferase